ncbi:hypothetical protein LTR91_016246 [Friedmanniomyces endolithicus]|uniref:Apple domain-containing protein n=1 Tax=Friedmanniomyces endolithicus TaxID=329885 RepID=A0A4U0U509_9PEZI|nr:hypothetical protein LTS09_013365 [Friedmanniomyces endolithicus]KAK0291663.1 hypothetical protein LTR35_001090 [Friedmanniomyces endolithicus]KAK0296664.1 hypothetical protein LTS00_004990 [Friedmanniomyces endolithicus]KAK0324812.1 hypothetical protein LTR82_004518 [Friedmanniomyces endolithicus]KAK0905165.1 hypothetical protein LTR57_018435 [Friedmanniomyces endolithicus]
MATLYSLLALATLMSHATAGITGLSSISTTSTTIITGAASLAPVSSYSYAFTVTTPTTVWSAPTFATSAPANPACSDTMCPSLNGKDCTDANGDSYGVLCDTRFSGTVITNSGKARLRMRGQGAVVGAAEEVEEGGLGKRDFTGSFDGCADFCDSYDDPSAPCTGVAFQGGYCMAFDTITGTFAQVGGIAAVRKVQ